MAARPIQDLDRAASKYIRTTADDRGITQKALADASGISVNTFGDYWRGQATITVGDLGNICAGLGVTIDEAALEIAAILEKMQSTRK